MRQSKKKILGSRPWMTYIRKPSMTHILSLSDVIRQSLSHCHPLAWPEDLMRQSFHFSNFLQQSNKSSRETLISFAFLTTSFASSSIWVEAFCCNSAEEIEATNVPFPVIVLMNPWRSSSSHAIFTGITLIRSSLAIVLIGGSCIPDFKFPFRIWVLIWEKSCK